MRHWLPDDLADPSERLPHYVAGRAFRSHLTNAVPHGIRPHRRHRWTARLAKALRPMQPRSPFRHRDTGLIFPHRQMTHPVLPHGQESVVENHASIEAPPTSAPPDERGYRDADGLITMCIGCHRMQQPDTDNWDVIPQWEASPPDQVTGGLCVPCFLEQYARYLPRSDEAVA